MPMEGAISGFGFLEKRTMWLSANQLLAKQRLFTGLGLAAVLGLSGCQMSIGGQTLPSPYWQSDDVQYFPAGPEFKLTREAAAMKAFKQEQMRAGPGAAAPAPGPGPGPMVPAGPPAGAGVVPAPPDAGP
ncbi:MAG TPA: hypothetical protein VF278_00820 [Pirellulales bacterium]